MGHRSAIELCDELEVRFPLTPSPSRPKRFNPYLADPFLYDAMCRAIAAHRVEVLIAALVNLEDIAHGR